MQSNEDDLTEFTRLYEEYKDYKLQQEKNENIVEQSFTQWLTEVARNADKSVDDIQLLIGKSMGIDLGGE